MAQIEGILKTKKKGVICSIQFCSHIFSILFPQRKKKKNGSNKSANAPFDIVFHGRSIEIRAPFLDKFPVFFLGFRRVDIVFKRRQIAVNKHKHQPPQLRKAPR
jgi:hypothetical protein